VDDAFGSPGRNAAGYSNYPEAGYARFDLHDTTFTSGAADTIDAPEGWLGVYLHVWNNSNSLSESLEVVAFDDCDSTAVESTMIVAYPSKGMWGVIPFRFQFDRVVLRSAANGGSWGWEIGYVKGGPTSGCDSVIWH